MESKSPMSWKLYRQELLVEEIDGNYATIDEELKILDEKTLELLVQYGLEPSSSLQNLSPPPSEDE